MRKFLLTLAAGTPALIGLVHAQGPGVEFEKDIWPIFEKKCVECHKAPYEENGRTKKPKGGLRLDGAWAITLGSENGAVLEPGNADESELYIRVTLPADDDDFMPPKDKAEPLTKEELEKFKKWIDDGADFGGWAGSLEGKPKEVTNAGDKIPTSEIQEVYKSLSKDLKPLEEDSWKDITAAGGRVMPLAESSPLLAVDFRLEAENVTDEQAATISKIGSNIAHLDFSKTKISDEALGQVSELKNLVRLDLHQTAVSDAGLAHLKGLDNLRYINLYGTQVSDAGLKHLESLKNLNAIYLWQSKATPAGVKKLEKALPDATINIK